MNGLHLKKPLKLAPGAGAGIGMRGRLFTLANAFSANMNGIQGIRILQYVLPAIVMNGM